MSTLTPSLPLAHGGPGEHHEPEAAPSGGWLAWVTPALASLTLLLGALALATNLANATLTATSDLFSRPNSAVCLVLGALALFADRYRARWPWLLAARQVGAAVMMLVAALTQVEYLLSKDFGIDEWLVPGWRGPALEVERMAPQAGVAFLLLGAALLLLDVETRRHRPVGAFFAFAAGPIGLVPLLGFAFGSRLLYGIPTFPPLAISSCLGVVLLSAGVVFARPKSDVVSVLASPTAGGRAARLLLPVGVVVPSGLGLLLAAGLKTGAYEPLFAFAALVAALVTILCAAIWWSALRLQSAEQVQSSLTRELAQETESARALKDALSRARASEQLLHTMFDSIRDYAIITLDAKGLVTSWNAGAQRLKGWAPSEIVGRHFSAFFTPEDVAEGKPQRLLDTAWRTGHSEDEGLRMRKNGERFWADAVVTPLYADDGSLLGFVKITRDFTERRQAEQALRATQARLERSLLERSAAVEELEAFSYSVSHDLRAPLRWLDGYSQALEEDYGQKLDEDGRALVKTVRESAQAMGRLIDAMLQLSRVTRGELRRVPVDLAALANTIVEQLRHDTPGRQVDVTIADGLTVEGDEALLNQVLANLLGNAWKFTRKVPHPRLELGRVEKDGQPAFFVRDNGAGFDPAFAGKLFRAFERLHTTAEFEGTGIGLAIVQRVVRRHGGRVWAESAVGQGTTFFFTLAGGADGPRP